MKKHTPLKKTRDEYTVVLEDIRSEFRVFGEGLQQVKTDLEEVKTDLGVVKTDLEFVKGELELIRHNQVTRDEFKFLETRVARLERARK